MKLRASTILAAASLCLAPAASLAAFPGIAPYSQDFEGLVQTDAGALSGDGWLVYGNVYDPAMNWLSGYGPFPAPNAAATGVPSAFCAIASDQGGDPQGAQQLSVYSNYEDGNHGLGNFVESNVYREVTVDAANLGETWYFEFDGKRGNVEGQSTAHAFIKTLDPSNGYALTNFLTVDMTKADTTWKRYSVSLAIADSLVGQLFQIGFMNTATNYEGSGVYYDNLELTRFSSVGVPQARTTGSGIELSARGNPAIGQAGQVLAFTLPRDGRVSVRVYDAGGALVSTLADGPMGAGVHQVTWRGRDASGRAVASGVYFAEVASGTERAIVKLSRLR